MLILNDLESGLTSQAHRDIDNMVCVVHMYEQKFSMLNA